MQTRTEPNPTLASAQGSYNLATLRSYIRLSQQEPNFEHWLQKAIFMRQLGYPLSPTRRREAQSWQQLGMLMKCRYGIYGHRQRQLRNLIDEVDEQKPWPAVRRADKVRVFHWRQQQAAVLKNLQQQVANAKSIIVVGNSPNIRAQQQGDWIDQHDIVFRFNHCFSAQTNHKDSGQKLDYWVVAPDYRGPLFGASKGAIITGPNMLWWRQNWQSLEQLKKPLNGIPLDTWRAAVRHLHAPPSAGFLLLSWLRQLRSEGTIATIGFGFSGTGEYHNAIKNHQAVSRHNWQREKELLSKWNLLNTPA